jgi:predicted membrane metal-binding protein
MCATPPLVLALLLSFAAGVLALQWQPELPSIAIVALAAAVALVSAIALRPCASRMAALRPLAALAVLLAAFAVGFGYAAARAEARLSDALPSEWEGEDIALTGVVDDLPQPSQRSTRFAFAVERVDTRNAIVPSRLSLSWYAVLRKDGAVDAVPALAGGERWQLVVRLKRPHGTVNPHGFDIEAWLLENGIAATGYVRTDERNRREDAFAGRLADYVLRARESIRSRILAALPAAPYAGVIVALTIGEQRAIPEASGACSTARALRISSASPGCTSPCSRRWRRDSLMHLRGGRSLSRAACRRARSLRSPALRSRPSTSSSRGPASLRCERCSCSRSRASVSCSPVRAPRPRSGCGRSSRC